MKPVSFVETNLDQVVLECSFVELVFVQLFVFRTVCSTVEMYSYQKSIYSGAGIQIGPGSSSGYMSQVSNFLILPAKKPHLRGRPCIDHL